MKTYSLGIVGIGRWGKRYIETINQMKGVKIVAIATSKPDNAKLVGKKVSVYQDIDYMLNHKDGMDGVIITTPPLQHATNMDFCIQNNTPFLVTKPFTSSYLGAQYIADYLKEKKTPCLVDHTQLFNPAFQALCKKLKGDRVVSIYSGVESFGPFRDNMLLDWAPHDISMCLELMKRMPKRVKAKFTSINDLDNAGIIDMELDFEDFVAEVKINNTEKNKTRQFCAEGKKWGYMVQGELLLRTKGSWLGIAEVYRRPTPLTNVVNSFINAIKNKKQIGVDMSVNVMKVIDSAQKSLTNGKWVKIA